MPMVESGSLPDSPDALTPNWLSEALSPSLPGVEVAKVEVLDRHSGSTGRALLRLDYASGVAGPETVFVKLPPFSEEQRKLVAATEMGRKEARFYDLLAAETPVRVPSCYFAGYGEEPTEYIMVLEDLEASGCTFTQSVEGHARDHGGQLAEALGQLHAHFWNDARFGGELSWIPTSQRGPLGPKLAQQALERFGDDFSPLFSELCRLYVDHCEPIRDLWDEGESTLVHGDTHSGNQFVDGKQVGLYDWAVISRSPGIRDFAIYMCNSCPADVRAAEEQGWLRTYREALVAGGVEAPDYDTLWQRYRRLVLYGWLGATTTAAVGDLWQPLSVSLPAVERATQTCAELGTLEAFREAL